MRRALAVAPWGSLLLDGARGKRFPVDDIAAVVLRLIDLVAGGELDTVEVNPLLVDTDGVVAVDALVVPTKGAT